MAIRKLHIVLSDYEEEYLGVPKPTMCGSYNNTSELAITGDEYDYLMVFVNRRDCWTWDNKNNRMLLSIASPYDLCKGCMEVAVTLLLNENNLL